MVQVQQVETDTWRWWLRWLRSTRRSCGGMRRLWDLLFKYIIMSYVTVYLSHQLAVDWGWCSDEAGGLFGHRWIWLPRHGRHQHTQNEICFAQGLLQWDRHSRVSQVNLTADFWGVIFSPLLAYKTTCFHLFRELSVGRGSTATLGGGVMPKINEVEAWDGKDGQVRGSCL